jgi:hypothetical protein
MADRKPPFDTDQLSQGIESIFGKAVEVLTKGREELLKQTRIGKVKLVDLMQLRRERARLVQRLGEEAYRGMQAGSLDTEDLERTYRKIVAMDEQIAAKEAEIEQIRREEEASSGSKKKSAGKTGANKSAKSKKRASDDDEDDEDDDESDDGE